MHPYITNVAIMHPYITNVAIMHPYITNVAIMHPYTTNVTIITLLTEGSCYYLRPLYPERCILFD
jgi:hypothetical protein